MIGDRIEYDNQFGTIRYVGTLNSSSTSWYGVEWDDPKRGKHDGTFQGVKYFSTKHPTGGSFIKLDGCSKSQSFFDAIVQKYCICDEDMKQELKFGSRMANVQYKTKENSIRLKNLMSALTFNQRVARLGEPNLVRFNCPNIQEVDLSCNLISQWSQVALIAQEITNLKTLILNKNRIALDVEDINQMDVDSFKNVENLCLKEMDLSWENVCDIFLKYRFIKCCELHLSFNRITIIQNISYFDNLKHLDLENNKLENWDEVNKLGLLPNLTSLQLNNCNIKSIYFTKVLCDGNFIKINKKSELVNERNDKANDSYLENKVSLFVKLENLFLADNLIDDIKSVDELDKLCSLKSLRLSRNPLLQFYATVTSFRSDVIARIGGIASLNGAKISAAERRGSEIDFVNMCTQQWLVFVENSKQQQNENDRETIMKKFAITHPRFFWLITKYKVNLDEEILSRQEATNIKSNLITLSFIFLKNESLTGNWMDRFSELISTKSAFEIVDKKVPKNLIVARLKGLVRKMFKHIHISSLVRVVQENSVAGTNSNHLTETDKFGFVLMDVESKSIDCYSVEDGDCIIVL